MDEIKKKISGCTETINDMSKHAYKCRNDAKHAHKKITSRSRRLRGTRFSINGSLIIVRRYQWNSEFLERHPFNWSFPFHTRKVITILKTDFNNGHSISLDSLREVIESLLEMNQEVVKVMLERKEEIWKDKQLFSFVLSLFSEVDLPILKLCTGLMKFLKGAGDTWLMDLVALQRIEAKRRAGTLNYLDRIQLIDINLGVAKAPFSLDLITLFQAFCDQQVAMLRRLHYVMKSTSVKHNANVTIAATLRTVLVSAVVALGIAKPLSMMTTIVYDTWIDRMFHSSSDWDSDKMISDLLFQLESHGKKYDEKVRWGKMRISDFDGILKLLEELRSKLRFPDFVTKEEEVEIVISMDEIKKKIGGFIKTIDDISKHVYKCYNDTEQARNEIMSGSQRSRGTRFFINGIPSNVRRYKVIVRRYKAIVRRYKVLRKPNFVIMSSC